MVKVRNIRKPRTGCYFDAEAFSIGMKMLAASGDHPGERHFNEMLSSLWAITTLAALNADFHYDFDTSPATPVWVAPAPGCSSLTGATQGSYRPFIQGHDILSDNSESALAVGIRL